MKAPGAVETSPSSFRFALPQLALLDLAFFFVFTARTVPSPLLPAIEADLALGHAQAASLFLCLSVGYGLATLLSGFLAARYEHRRLITAAVTGGSLSLLALAASPSLALLRASMALIGLTTGLYLPSAVPAATALAPAGEAGRVLAVHELAPNLAYVLIPLLAAFFVPRLSWRWVLAVLGLGGLAASALYLLRGRSGRFLGEAPNLANLRLILGRPAFWALAALFALGVGSGMGVFSILPTYLVYERGLEPTLVNLLVGLSRASGLGAVFLAGWLADRFGPRAVLAAVLAAAGLATAGLGSAGGAGLVLVLFVQPLLTACFFPVGFALMGRITPRRVHNVTVSLVLPIAFALGAGLVPFLLGVAGDRGAFGLGLLVLGGLAAAGSLLVLLLRLELEGGGVV